MYIHRETYKKTKLLHVQLVWFCLDKFHWVKKLQLTGNIFTGWLEYLILLNPTSALLLKVWSLDQHLQSLHYLAVLQIQNLESYPTELRLVFYQDILGSYAYFVQFENPARPVDMGKLSTIISPIYLAKINFSFLKFQAPRNIFTWKNLASYVEDTVKKNQSNISGSLLLLLSSNLFILWVSLLRICFIRVSLMCFSFFGQQKNSITECEKFEKNP